ncbi:RNA polymerase sigma-70 factor, ECF subfamily [Paenibacillus sp. UNCCL117]|uniref:RNA polymerase sigma factor n=1 Tax=unclassified Paenibacillus TaxID=185978 RepID=UPI00088E2A4D|nr:MULTISPECIES: sigma-70 family RNA polymerase sigma factor [unclassified Paenibacillus]SDE08292.1 RNA polymerase sigma-70 factor, ECF subfamily [Paenibacillus sp. cl123]SFW58992.1 RNA polymerase sigma-70 factor, ECF subfamily [Paenibacillus sp. UNCCL117]
MDSEVNFDYLKYLSDCTDKKEILHELMTAYGKDVWNYAYSITRKWDQADDITQEVFIKVFRNLYTFRSESSVKTWLLAITRNMTLDYRKSAFLRKVTLVDAFSAKEEQAAASSAEQEVMGRLRMNEMWDLVLKLPVKYREVLILFAHHQLSMKEIADVLGVSEGTVKSRLFHARGKISRLKESLDHGTDRQ